MEVPRAWLHENALRTMTQKTVNDVLTKDNWKKDDVRKACMSVRQYQQKLGYSGEWMAEYVYNIVILAKKRTEAKGCWRKRRQEITQRCLLLHC